MQYFYCKVTYKTLFYSEVYKKAPKFGPFTYFFAEGVREEYKHD